MHLQDNLLSRKPKVINGCCKRDFFSFTNCLSCGIESTYTLSAGSLSVVRSSLKTAVLKWMQLNRYTIALKVRVKVVQLSGQLQRIKSSADLALIGKAGREKCPRGAEAGM